MVMASGDEEESSPSKKVKFLCSHGGRIVVRPSDGHLKYVGGETRVVAVPRHISFSELKQKLSEMVQGETVLKYQIMPDILVTVRTDEDLHHMIHHHDSSPKLRAFLFTSNSNFHRVQSSPTCCPPPRHSPHFSRIIHRAESLPLPPRSPRRPLWD